MIDHSASIPNDVASCVANALAEDIGSGDITAQLIPEKQSAVGKLICREPAILCGKPYAEAVFAQLGGDIQLNWHAEEGRELKPGQVLLTLAGNARVLLTGERPAINFLQTLSGTATVTKQLVELIAPYPAQLLDSRKTLPGLRQAQKYAVRCGGGENHRMGLFDAYLIKENHIISCGSITTAIQTAKQQAKPDQWIEIEVESLDELQEALAAAADRIMLDNFTLTDLEKAVAINAGQAKLEASGNITLETIVEIAKTGVDYISTGAITKNVKAIDMSLRF